MAKAIDNWQIDHHTASVISIQERSTVAGRIPMMKDIIDTDVKYSCNYSQFQKIMSSNFDEWFHLQITARIAARASIASGYAYKIYCTSTKYTLKTRKSMFHGLCAPHSIDSWLAQYMRGEWKWYISRRKQRNLLKRKEELVITLSPLTLQSGYE